MIGKPRIDRFGQVHPPRRALPLPLVIVVAVLVMLSLGAREGLQRFVNSFANYRPPAMPRLEAGNGTTPIAERAVLIIVSGLRDDAASEMPTLQALRRQGSQVEVRVPWPSSPQNAWTTLLSGATPELSGAVHLLTQDGDPRPMAVDHLLRRARVTRHTIGLAGHRSWEAMIPVAGLAEVITSAGKSTEDDARIIQQIVDTLAASPPDLMVIQLSQMDAAGETYGGESDEYYRAAQRVDALIRRVLSAVDLSRTVLAITSDRGYPGARKGSEAAFATVPLVLAGPGVKPGDHGTIDQNDIAPTLAVLLGVPVPAESQGTIRFAMLDMELPLRAEKAMSLAEQQIRLSDSYLRAIGQGGGSGQPAQTLSVARSAWDIGNVQGAFEIALQGDHDARQEMAAGRANRIAEERRQRRSIALGAGAAFLVGLLLLMNRRVAWLLGAALLAWLGPLGNADALTAILDSPNWRWAPAVVGVTLALAAAAWAWRTRRRQPAIVAALALGAGVLISIIQPAFFSPGAVRSMETLRTAAAWHSMAALLIGGGAVLSLTSLTEPDLGRIARASYWFVGLLLAGLIVQLAVGYWLLGLGATWFLPDANLVYWHLAGLAHTMLLAGLGIFLPAIVIPVALALQRLQTPAPARTHAGTPTAEKVHP